MQMRPTGFLLAFLLICCEVAAQGAQERFDFRRTPGHLSKDVIPSSYALRLNLDPALDVFGATVAITLRVNKPMAVIELHAHELEADSAQLVSLGKQRGLNVSARAATQTWVLTPEDGAPIPTGVHELAIAYRGIVHGSGEGLFRAEASVGGQPQRMLATQLQAIFARTLFPSFDEPAFRADFELTVVAPAGYQVLSNMPGTKALARGDSVEHSFARTPPMPSYLVAVAVGHFDVLEGRIDGLPLRILTAPGKRAQAQYALEVTKQVVPFYASYFRQPYTLPRLDQLAVPGTRWGAMEDWGLISYAEDNLLYDPAQSSPETQQEVFSIVAHEIAHQWFGNLVTAATWNEIWLNEAFATWLADKAADRFNPRWQVNLQRRTPIDRVMLRDGGTSTRAIRSGPVTESRVFDVFDGITYTKGGAVLSMLEQWLGPQAFQRGLARYIAQRRLSNATAGDLWFHLGRASGRDVAAVALSWTDQEGFPLVRVSSRCERGATLLSTSQQRFGFVATNSGSSTQRWQIPLQIRRGAQTATVLQTQAQQTFRLPGCSDEPLVVNAGGEGFYRVEYDAQGFAAISREFAKLSAADQVMLLSDSFALAQAGTLPMKTFFALLAAIPSVQGAGREMLTALAIDDLLLLYKALTGTAAQSALRAAAVRLLRPELARLGWVPRTGESSQTLALRAGLIEKLAWFDDAQSIEEALRRFDRDASGGEPLPVSTRAGVVRAAGMHANQARFDDLLARLKNAEGMEDRWLFAGALASGRDGARLQQVLDLSLAAGLSPNVATSLPGMVAERSPFGEQAYQFTRENWPALAALAGTAGRQWLLPGVSMAFNDSAAAARLVDDQRQTAGTDGAALAARFAARIELLAQIRQREAAALSEFLPAWRPAEPLPTRPK